MNDFIIDDKHILDIIEKELSKENNRKANRYNPFELLRLAPLLDETIERYKIKSLSSETGFISDAYTNELSF